MPGIIVKAATFDRYMQTLAVSLLNGSDDRGGRGGGGGTAHRYPCSKN